MARFVVTAVGSDRPGIVAAVTGGLLDAGCNLRDSAMTILEGHFAVLLMLEAPSHVAAADLEAALAGSAAGLDLDVSVRAVPAAAPPPAPGETWTVSVYGADRPGIVHGVSKCLADRGVNIVDLRTHVLGDPAAPVYALLLDVEVPAGTDAETLGAALRTLAGELGVDCSLHETEADVL